MSDSRILPQQLLWEVEHYVESELRDERKYENREPFDESGVSGLHRLAALIYAQGFADGEQAQATRDAGQRRRERITGPTDGA